MRFVCLPREIISYVETLKAALTPISRGECSGHPARAVLQRRWRNLVVRVSLVVACWLDSTSVIGRPIEDDI